MQHMRQLIGRDVGIAMNQQLWIAGLGAALEDHAHRVTGIDKYSPHRGLL
jgi:hypothetical protein